jgi:hypothetical protein
MSNAASANLPQPLDPLVVNDVVNHFTGIQVCSQSGFQGRQQHHQ